MTRRQGQRDAFPRAVGAASAFLIASGATLLALGLLSSEVWYPETHPVVRAIALGEAAFLIALGVLPVVLWALARRAKGRGARADGEGAWRWDIPT